RLRGGARGYPRPPGVPPRQAENETPRHVQRQPAVGRRRCGDAAAGRHRRAVPLRQRRGATAAAEAQRPVHAQQCKLGGLRRVFRLLPDYRGPRPTRDDFVPYGGDLDKLDGPRDARLVQAFRCGMLLNGIDLPGLSGMTTSAHREADVDQTVAAVTATLELLREEGMI